MGISSIGSDAVSDVEEAIAEVFHGIDGNLIVEARV
jgi:hypothetical protein